mgnify:CR=1 FL=1
MNTKPHGIMFHHFHGQSHPKVQGSISSTDFENIIKYLKKNFKLLDASEFFLKACKNSLSNYEICITFDDGLLCQYDIALPILNKYKIKAFFNIYSSIFTENPSNLEIFRHFRTTAFRTMEEFYTNFFLIVEKEEVNLKNKKLIFNYKNYLPSSTYLSSDDKWFRYLRDHVLDKSSFEKINFQLMKEKKYDLAKSKSNLWMKKRQVFDLNENGHQIGLHTHNHPTNILSLNQKEQKFEYERNKNILENIIKKKIYTMSHPCGKYSGITISILKEIGIILGFRSNLEIKGIKSSLEVPRENHANLLKRIH